MTLADVIAVILLAGVILYAIFGGADFGAGFWDLTAGGAARGAKPRLVIEESIGPVWEANHVWLIFCLVVIWTCFSEAFASITLTLFVPLSLAAAGIVLRGSGFAFRKVVVRTRYRRLFGGAFALSSIIVPFCLGAVAGGIASGRVPAGGTTGDLWDSWLNPTSLVGGVLAIAVCAYLSAVFLVSDAHRLSDQGLVEYFRRRAIAAAIGAGVIATSGIFLLRNDNRFLIDRLLGRALPVVLLSMVLGVVGLVLLVRGAATWARFLAIGAVGSIVAAWGVAQYPYILAETLKIETAAAPDATLWTVLIVFLVAVVVLVPSLGLLYVLDQRSLLDVE
ncbi:MAG TPA: cytochrome d ubiquinol oxidase subunit II [Acidimicrobiia bacterium]|nr:cytochrome d ubiquinol oxidase subunit II [Acidimicrobiia bacterium]